MGVDKYDYIIVGSGLAGSTLAMQLDALKKKILVFEGTQDNVSSMVAAGLFNPITGKKMVKTWRADDLFTKLSDYYPKCERLTGSKFLNERAIYRPFIFAEEQNEWMGKSTDDSFKAYIDEVVMKSTAKEINDKYGGLRLSSTGFVDIPVYLKSVKKYLLSNKQRFVSEDFDYDKLKIDGKKLSYGDETTGRVIFCEGAKVERNPFFSWLPIRPVKGEILFIRTDYKMDYILNRGVFVLPIGDGVYKVGSTYDHNDLSIEPTEKGKEQIMNRLNEILTCDFEIIDHVVGIRPATKDRRPFVGVHPEIETIGVFNGLGAKGVSLAPYWSNHLVEHLESGKKLDSDVNISRYFSLYSGSFKR